MDEFIDLRTSLTNAEKKECCPNLIRSLVRWCGSLLSRAILWLIFAISPFPVSNSTISCLCGGYQRDSTPASRNPIFPPCFFFYFRACTSLFLLSRTCCFSWRVAGPAFVSDPKNFFFFFLNQMEVNSETKLQLKQ